MLTNDACMHLLHFYLSYQITTITIYRLYATTMASPIQRKKDGSPNVKFYESLETIALFDGIKNWLQKNYKKVFESDP